MRFSKMPSIGNSCDLTTADVLEAHAVDAVDSETNLIEVYLNSGADMKHNRQPGSQGEWNLAIMDAIKKLFIWMASAGLTILAILLPIVVVTDVFGGHPLAAPLALVGLVLLAFGVAWYVRTRSTRF
jgi:hypothetical protein